MYDFMVVGPAYDFMAVGNAYNCVAGNAYDFSGWLAMCVTANNC